MNGVTDLRKVLVIYTGGTFGMKRNDQGVLVPVPNILTPYLKTCNELHDPNLAKACFLQNDELITKVTSCNKNILYKIKELNPLLDSSNMDSKEWVIIAKNIEENFLQFDGFVVLHGTDTLAYTSSVLSFMFKNLNKPIIITGSQIPIFENPNDARSNMLSSLVFASCADIAEVCVFISNKLMRGNRIKKVDTTSVNCFESPNYPLLADSGFHCKIIKENILSRPKQGFLTVFTNLSKSVGILYIFPALTKSQLVSFLDPTIEGLVLMTYGAGNIPSDRKDLMDELKHAVERGLTIVYVSQVYKGTVSVTYETGKIMEELGIIPCYDMTVEAAYAKLAVVCGMTRESMERAKLMKQIVSGEMTIPH